MSRTLLTRHADAWMSDPWYRRALFVAPFTATLLLGALLTRSGHPTMPPTAAGWAHQTNDPALARELATLRDRAKTDPEALKLLLARANEGQSFAQFYMGTLFDPNLDPAHATPARTGEALAWYRKAADRGNMTAAGNLGTLLAVDRPGHPANLAEAFRWLDLAAPTNFYAQFQLGLIYRYGRGVPVDVAKGMDLIRTAADHNNILAELSLAQAYDQGTDGLSQDHHEAAMLYQKAAMANNTVAQRELAIHLMNGIGVPADRSRAMSWFKRAAGHGDTYSKAQLAVGDNGSAVPGQQRQTTAVPSPQVPTPSPTISPSPARPTPPLPAPPPP